MTSSELTIPKSSTLEEFLALAELGRQAQIIFHDVANHITSLQLTVQELEQNAASEKERLKEYAKRSRETRAQVEHVARLLRYHLENRDESFRADKITREILDLFAYKINKAHIRVNLDLTSNVYLPAGKRNFIQIITNLIGNAIESFESVPEKAKKEISVTLSRNGPNIHLTVSDTGCGIPQENRERIFGGITTKKHGHGIGLVAVQENVTHVFRGTIRLESSKDGTTFHITIPTQNRRRNSPPVARSHRQQILLNSLESLRDHSTV